MSQKTLIFGSSFNPVHNGHLSLVKTLSQEPWVGEVVLLPCGQHAFNKQLAPAADRLNMLRLSLSDLPPNISISTYEIDRADQKSYTYQTLQAFQKNYPHQELMFVIGSENLPQYHLWYKADQLATEFDLLIVERPESPLPKKLPFPRMQRYLSPKLPVLPGVSSTLIREKISAGENISDLTPKAVAEYIAEKRLYL